MAQETGSGVRYRKNSRSASLDDSRRFSCGSIVARRASMYSPRITEIPVENIVNQSKIETLQWQLKEIEKSREMYKAVMKQVVTFLEKAHLSLENLGIRLNRKNPVPRSKSEYHIVADNISTTSNQKYLIEEHLNSWNSTKKQDLHPEEVPPEKLSQEAFRLLRTAQSLLSTQEPSLTSSETLCNSEDPLDIEFLAQLAREFPQTPENQRPHRATSFSLSPKLILPESEIRISTAFNRKLSLQLGEVRRRPGLEKTGRCDSARGSVAESECNSLCGGERNGDILRNGDCLEGMAKTVEKSNSPATASISSVEDESGFSSMNSFQDVGLPLMNSTVVDEVSARSVLLKSMLHNNSDYGGYLNDSGPNSCISESTVVGSPRLDRLPEKNSRALEEVGIKDEKYNNHINSNDVKLWQKPVRSSVNSPDIQKPLNSSLNLQVNHKRWRSTPDESSNSHSLKVLWV